MNETTTAVCRTLYEKMHLLSQSSINTLIAINILVAFSNVIVNSMLIYIMKVTRQYQNSSLRLTMYMSFSDFLVGLVSQQMLTYFLVESYSSISCNMQVLCQYILYIFPHMTGFFVGLVALDRYLRVKYTNRYNEVMTFKRQTLGVVVIGIMAILNCMVLISGVLTGNWTLALLGIQPLDMTFVTCDILLYWRAIMLMKEHVRNKNAEIKNLSKSISKLATIYLVLVIIFYPPYLVTDMILAFVHTTDSVVVFWHVLSLIWVFLNSGVNAISFLVVNRKARRLLREWFERKTNFQKHNFELDTNDRVVSFNSISKTGEI